MADRFLKRLVVIRVDGGSKYVTRITGENETSWIGDDQGVYDKHTRRDGAAKRRIVTADTVAVNETLNHEHRNALQARCRKFIESASIEQLGALERWIYTQK